MKTKPAEPKSLQTQQERIHYLFQQTGQTQQEFAASLGIGQPHLSGVMSIRKPSKRLLVMIAEKTGANLEWLVSGDGEVYRPGIQGPEDPPELARVIEEARKMWDTLDDDVERFEMAAMMLRTLADRNKKKRMNGQKDNSLK
ncbi:helix-turn-helix domain-containing protein [Geomonas subterranea]|uniref:helix-turn-helix domain-containing protein n=1 Tax=Geomonas subterranea TaxID=2847989 RepID=UPI001CD7137A|nr:helix-turn-helix domain-containing protein [Geomonas fuzhouensis]